MSEQQQKGDWILTFTGVELMQIPISREALHALPIAEAAEFLASPSSRELALCRLLDEAREEIAALKAGDVSRATRWTEWVMAVARGLGKHKTIVALNSITLGKRGGE